ncbi:MAG: M48 family metallopeptidase [Verrucomicrobiales bacterium]
MASNFFERQDRARKRTGLLVFLFCLAVLGLIGCVYFLFLIGTDTGTLFDPALLGTVSVGVVSVIGLGSGFKSLSLRAGGESIASQLGGIPLNPATRDPAERRLMNVVEEMAIASGVPVPTVFVLPEEDGINAFAAGLRPTEAVIGITRGALNTLTRDELQGVIAHEFSHVLNGDMKLNFRLIGILHGILLLAFIGRILIRSGVGRGGGSGRGNNALPLIGIGLYLVGMLGVFFGNMIKAAVSREREYLADAAAVQFTRNPDGIGGALKKIGALSQGSKLHSAQASEASHLLFSDGLSRQFGGSLATHPPLMKRIRAVDPHFDGDFTPILKQMERLRQRQLEEQQAANAAAASGAEMPFGAIFAGGGLPGADALGQAGAGLGAAGHVVTTAILAEDSKPQQPLENADQFTEQVGTVSAAHTIYACELRESLPDSLLEAAHELYTAQAVILSLLLDKEETLRQHQNTLIEERLGHGLLHEIQKLVPSIQGLPEAARLPLLDLTLPTLRGIAPQQYQTFRDTVTALIESDGNISLFEFVLAKMLTRHLDHHFSDHRAPKVKYHQPHEIAVSQANVLGLVAMVSRRAEDSPAAFANGWADFMPEQNPDYESTNRSLGAFSQALEQIEHASSKLKERVIHSAAAVAYFDGHITVEQAELLRALGDCLDCPIPPMLPSAPASST